MLENLQSIVEISCRQSWETCLKGRRMLEVGVGSLWGKKGESKALCISVGIVASRKEGKRSGWRPADRSLAAQMS